MREVRCGHASGCVQEEVGGMSVAVAIDFDPGHSQSESQRINAGVELSVQPSHGNHGTHRQSVGLDSVDWRDYVQMRVAAETYSDVQKARIQLFNRAGLKADGQKQKNFDAARHVSAAWLEDEMGKAKEAEDRIAGSVLRYYYEFAPSGVIEWQSSNPGVGEMMVARLLGHLGHPRIALPAHWEGKGKKNRVLVHTEPYRRTVAQLWSYCGLGDPLRRPYAGMSADAFLALGNPILKTVAYLLAHTAGEMGEKSQQEPKRCAETIHGAAPAGTTPDPSKTSSEHSGFPPGRDLSDMPPIHAAKPTRRAGAYPYRKVYDSRRAETVDRVHATACHKCTKNGKPSLPGSPWRPGHQQADANRIVAKAILKDIWLAAEL